MNYRDIVKGQLRVDEDWRRKPYRCTAGKLTIGVGRNLDDVGLRDDEIALMLDNDVRTAESDARALVPNFNALSDVRKAVLINMSFNLGYARLAKFVNTLAAVNEGRFDAAADGMADSLWARQVGARAVRLVKQMREG